MSSNRKGRIVKNYDALLTVKILKEQSSTELRTQKRSSMENGTTQDELAHQKQLKLIVEPK